MSMVDNSKICDTSHQNDNLLHSTTSAHMLPCGRAGRSIDASQQMAGRRQHFSLSITNIPVFPEFASELNPPLFTPKDAVKPSLAEIFDEMEALEPPTKTMQANYLDPPKADRLVAGEPTLQRKAFVTPQPLSWTDKLLCPHTHGQNNKHSRCTPDSQSYIMLPADP